MNKILTNQECISLLKKHETPLNIFLHCRKVNAISMFIATKLKELGKNIDLCLVSNGSLLHDVAKYNSIKDKTISHTKAGSDILEEINSETANVIFKHGYGTLINDQVNTWEEKIVNYADSRVRHEEIVSINERIDDLNIRYEKIYPGATERNEIARMKSLDIEKEIFENLDINPNDITENTIKEYLIEDDY